MECTTLVSYGCPAKSIDIFLSYPQNNIYSVCVSVGVKNKFRDYHGIPNQKCATNGVRGKGGLAESPWCSHI